jgi:lysophospholipase L1-like esterase
MARILPPSVSLKRLLCVLLLVFVALSIWRKHWVLSVQSTELLYRGYSKLAERDAGTPRQQRWWEQRLLRNFAQTNRYRIANSALPSPSPDRIVLYGDSITDLWPMRDSELFASDSPYIARGISGQATPELLWRLQQDALDLHPATIVLLAGTNDIVLRGRHIGEAETQSNLLRMITLAQQRGIRVVLCSLLPVRYQQPLRQHLYLVRITALNRWLRQYAAEHHLAYVDYFDAIADSHGTLPEAISTDGLHPNAEGYRVMQKVLLQALTTTR